MDNDDAIVGTILSRRSALFKAAKLGAGIAAATVFSKFAHAGPTTAPAHLFATPEMTEGPFFVDEKLNRPNLIAGTTRAAVVKAVPLTLSFTVSKLLGQAISPLANAMLDVWHCDATGVYSDENNPMNHENTADQRWLRGYQITDNKGQCVFQTIVPGWYEGRTSHIHFKVRQLSADGKKITSEFTSQLFFNDKLMDQICQSKPYIPAKEREIWNADDDIYMERLSDGSSAGSHQMLNLKKSSPADLGYATQFSIVLTDEKRARSRRW